MVVLHFAITDKNKQVKFQIDILSREDANDNERGAAKAIEELLMEIIKTGAKETGLIVTTRKVKKK